MPSLTPARLVSLYSVDPGERSVRRSQRQSSAAASTCSTRCSSRRIISTWARHALQARRSRCSLCVLFLFGARLARPCGFIGNTSPTPDWIPLPFNARRYSWRPDGDGEVTPATPAVPTPRRRRSAAARVTGCGRRLGRRCCAAGFLARHHHQRLAGTGQVRQGRLRPDAAFSDGQSLDVSKDFYPFGQMPRSPAPSPRLQRCVRAAGRDGEGRLYAVEGGDSANRRHKISCRSPGNSRPRMGGNRCRSAKGPRPSSSSARRKPSPSPVPHAGRSVMSTACPSAGCGCGSTSGDYGQPLVTGLDAQQRPVFGSAEPQSAAS